jgi:hypothetical protein
VGTRRAFRPTTPGLVAQRTSAPGAVNLLARIEAVAGGDGLPSPLQATVAHGLRRSIAIAMALSEQVAQRSGPRGPQACQCGGLPHPRPAGRLCGAFDRRGAGNTAGLWGGALRPPSSPCGRGGGGNRLPGGGVDRQRPPSASGGAVGTGPGSRRPRHHGGAARRHRAGLCGGSDGAGRGAGGHRGGPCALHLRLLAGTGRRPHDPRLLPLAQGAGPRAADDLQEAGGGRRQPHRQAPGHEAFEDADGLRL